MNKILLMFAAVVVATGCASHKETIHFSDEADIHSAIAASVVPSASPQKHLEKADQLKIEQIVFGALLEGHFWDASDYSAVFLQADDAQVSALMQAYPHHNPPIKPSYHALLQAHKTPLDKDTDRPAMILSVDVNEPNDDDSVNAIGRWFAGDAVSGFHLFTLKKVEGAWQVVSVK